MQAPLPGLQPEAISSAWIAPRSLYGAMRMRPQWQCSFAFTVAKIPSFNGKVHSLSGYERDLLKNGNMQLSLLWVLYFTGSYPELPKG